MQVLKIHSYAYFGTKQFPVDIPLICSTELFNAVSDSPTTFMRDYRDLNETTPQRIFKQNFGVDIYSAIKKANFYIGVLPEQAGNIPDMSLVSDIFNLLDMNIPSYLLLDSTYTPSPSALFYRATNIINASGDSYNISSPASTWTFGCGSLSTSGTEPMILGNFYCATLFDDDLRIDDVTNNRVYFNFGIYKDDSIINGKANSSYLTNSANIQISGYISYNDTISKIKRIQFTNVGVSNNVVLNNFLNDIELPDYTIQTDDISNPYGEDGTSTSGGGDGTLGPGGLDDIDPTDVPELPNLSAAATGFITMYNPSSANLSALGNFLWSGMFDLDTYKKLFADPMEGIIGLGIVPVLPNSAGSRNIMFGNVDSGINCSYLASQYASKDCGSVELKKYVGSFMDYSPYVKVSLFLPYIGFVNLGTDDLIGGSINVKYNVDVLSGDCVAFIKHSEKGVLYAYNGNCLTNVPVSGQNYANALRNYYESVAGVIPATTNGATGGPAGAIGGAIAGTLSAASNIILNSKPTFQRSGNIGGSAGIMGVQKPFVIIERPNISVPNQIQHYAGQTSNITMALSGCKGMTVVEHVHLNGIHATSEELREIETILKGGVIL